MTIRVVLEVAPKRSFASALDWPGWSRGGKTGEDALDALLRYGPRYAAVARRAKVAFTPPATLRDLEVVERLTGGSGTEFGVPSAAAASEDDPLNTGDLARSIGLLRASWATFDAAAARAEGVTLSLGPRGGGRQVPKIVEHVREAEVAYLAKLGSRAPAGSEEDGGRSMARLRGAFTDAVESRTTGEPLARPNKTQSLWSPRYAVRRSAWHALDHAWEIEDRSAR